MSQLVSAVSQAVQSLQALPSIIFPEDFSVLDGIFAVYSTISCSQDVESFAAGIIGAEEYLGLIPKAAEAPAELAPALAALPQLNSAASAPGLGGLPNAITVSMGRANSIGPLSVPAGWEAPSTTRVAALPGAGLTTLPGTGEAAGSGMPGVPGMRAGTVARASGVIPRYGVRLTVMPRPPAAG